MLQRVLGVKTPHFVPDGIRDVFVMTGGRSQAWEGRAAAAGNAKSANMTERRHAGRPSGIDRWIPTAKRILN